jgi:HSP20 family protein
MSIIKWEPFGEVDRFFNDFPSMNLGRDMAVDLYEDGPNLIAEMNVSGIDPEKIDISIEGNYLRISGSREEKKETKEKQFYSKEISRGSFERAIRLPETVSESAVKAECENGVLKIVMPKAEEKKKEKIKVQIKK